MRYRKTFTFANTEQEAQTLCAEFNRNPYLRRKHPAHYTPWTSRDQTEHKFVVWHYTK